MPDDLQPQQRPTPKPPRATYITQTQRICKLCLTVPFHSFPVQRFQPTNDVLPIYWLRTILWFHRFAHTKRREQPTPYMPQRAFRARYFITDLTATKNDAQSIYSTVRDVSCVPDCVWHRFRSKIFLSINYIYYMWKCEMVTTRRGTTWCLDMRISQRSQTERKWNKCTHHQIE